MFAAAQLLAPVGVSAVQTAEAAESISGATYYVAQNGSDSGAGSQAAPFKTIAKAAEAAKAGDTVLVKGGSYSGQVTFTKSGNSSAYITIKAAEGEQPKITASGSKYAFDFAGQSYIRVEGFDVSGSQSHLFRLENASSNGNIIAGNILHDTTNRGDGVRIMGAKNTQVLRNKMHNVQYGVKVERADGGNGSTNTLIKGNEIYKPGVDCIYLAAPGVTVDGNNLHDNNATYSAGEHADGVQVYMKSYTANSKFVFSNNIIDLKDQPGSQRQCNSLMLENAGGITIFNNVINGRGESNGINLKSCPDSQVFNNTVVDVDNSTIYIHKGSTVASSNVKVYNNITPAIKVLSDGSQSGHLAGNNLVGGDPQFVDKAAGDFKIKAGSPAVDAGYANVDKRLAYPETCIDGGQRIVGSRIDIGAYEFGSKPVVSSGDKPADSVPTVDENVSDKSLVPSDNDSSNLDNDSATMENGKADTCKSGNCGKRDGKCDRVNDASINADDGDKPLLKNKGKKKNKHSKKCRDGNACKQGKKCGRDAERDKARCDGENCTGQDESGSGTSNDATSTVAVSDTDTDTGTQIDTDTAASNDVDTDTIKGTDTSTDTTTSAGNSEGSGVKLSIEELLDFLQRFFDDNRHLLSFKS